MRTTLLALLGVVALVMAGCSPDGGSIFPIFPDEADGPLDEASAQRNVTLFPDESRTFRVSVSPDDGEQVVLMTSSGVLRVFDGGSRVASSTSETFFTSSILVPASNADAIHQGRLDPAITVTSPDDFRCLGPCVALDASDYSGTITVEVENNASQTRTIGVYAVAAPYFDPGEPSNDSSSAAVSLPSFAGQASAAIEVLGDVDWFEATVDANHEFFGSRDVEMRAEIYYDGALGSPDEVVLFGDFEGSKTTFLAAGDLVRVSANQSSVATAYYSSYGIGFP